MKRPKQWPSPTFSNHPSLHLHTSHLKTGFHPQCFHRPCILLQVLLLFASPTQIMTANHSTHACAGLVSLLSHCSPKFITAFVSSLTFLDTTAARCIHAALLRLLDDCGRVTDVICDIITDAAAADLRVGSSSGEASAFIVAASNACGIQLSVALHMTGAFT